MRISESEWSWFGYPQHFIGAANCRFRMATMVGRWLISTVGDYHPHQNNLLEPPTTLGCDKDGLFETYVFPCDGVDGCGCCPRITELSEVFGQRCATATEAQRQHIEICKLYADK